MDSVPRVGCQGKQRVFNDRPARLSNGWQQEFLTIFTL